MLKSGSARTSTLLIVAAVFLAGFMLLLPRASLLLLLIELEPRWLAAHALFLSCFLALLVWKNRGRLDAHARFLSGACLAGLLGLFVALLLPPETHRIYFDEDIYGQIGFSMARESRAGMLEASEPRAGSEGGWRGVSYLLNKEPTGFPFLVSLTGRILDLADRKASPDDAGRTTNLFFFVMGIVGMAVLARGFLPDASRDRGALLAALLFALWPENLRWAVTGAVEVTAASLAVWSLILAREAAREGGFIETNAAMLMLALAVQQRPEGLLLVLPFLALAGRNVWIGKDGKIRNSTAAAAFIVILAPHAVHLLAMSGEDWGAGGPKFAVSHVLPNLKANLGYWTRGADVRMTPAPSAAWSWFSLLGLVTLILRARGTVERAGAVRAISVVVSWFVLFFAVFIPFYAGSYFYGADIRFSLLVIAPVMILAACGIDALSSQCARLVGHPSVYAMAALTIAAPVVIPQVMPLASPTAEARQARADHASVELFSRGLPPDALVLSHTPSMWALRNVASAQVSFAQAHPEWLLDAARRYSLYYHAGYWDISYESKNPGPERYLPLMTATEMRRVESEGKWVFRLYRLHQNLAR